MNILQLFAHWLAPYVELARRAAQHIDPYLARVQRVGEVLGYLLWQWLRRERYVQLSMAL